MPRSRSALLWSRFRKLAAEQDKLPFEVQIYVVPICKFHDLLEKHRKLVKGLNTFKPYLDRLRAIEQTLEEGIEWLLNYDEDDDDPRRSYPILVEILSDHTASELEGWLGGAPTISDLISDNPSKKYSRVLGDIDVLVERLAEEINEEGFQLYHVLRGE